MKTLEQIKEMNLLYNDKIEVTTIDSIDMVYYVGINHIAKDGPALIVKCNLFRNGAVKKYGHYPISAIEKIKRLEYKK